jgi:hypothetical protein
MATPAFLIPPIAETTSPAYNIPSISTTATTVFLIGILQHLWNDLNLPPGKQNLNQLKNHLGHRVPIKRLIVAYFCSLNLANLTSYCTLSSRTGLKVSSFI